MWNWARKPLENLLREFSIWKGQPSSIPTVSKLPAAHGPAMGDLDPLPLSPCGSLTAVERMWHPERCWPGQMLQEAEQDSLQHRGANFLADHQVCFGPLPTYPKRPIRQHQICSGHTAVNRLNQVHTQNSATLGRPTEPKVDCSFSCYQHIP